MYTIATEAEATDEIFRNNVKIMQQQHSTAVQWIQIILQIVAKFYCKNSICIW